MPERQRRTAITGDSAFCQNESRHCDNRQRGIQGQNPGCIPGPAIRAKLEEYAVEVVGQKIVDDKQEDIVVS